MKQVRNEKEAREVGLSLRAIKEIKDVARKVWGKKSKAEENKQTKAKYIFRFQNIGEDYLRKIALKSYLMDDAFCEVKELLDRAGRTLNSLEKIHIEEVKQTKPKSSLPPILLNPPSLTRNKRRQRR